MDPKLRPEARKRLQLLALGAQWQEQLSYLETPDQTLEREKAITTSRLKDAQARARACVIQDPQYLAQFDTALVEAFRFHGELMELERQCDCAAKERQENYERQYSELMLKFPIPLDVSSSVSLSSTNPNHITPRREASEVSTGFPGFHPSMVSLPPDSVESANVQGAAPDAEFSSLEASAHIPLADNTTGVNEAHCVLSPDPAPVS